MRSQTYFYGCSRKKSSIKKNVLLKTLKAVGKTLFFEALSKNTPCRIWVLSNRIKLDSIITDVDSHGETKSPSLPQFLTQNQKNISSAVIRQL